MPVKGGAMACGETRWLRTIRRPGLAALRCRSMTRSAAPERVRFELATASAERAGGGLGWPAKSVWMSVRTGFLLWLALKGGGSGSQARPQFTSGCLDGVAMASAEAWRVRASPRPLPRAPRLCANRFKAGESAADSPHPGRPPATGTRNDPSPGAHTTCSSRAPTARDPESP